jgi:hypothetical protein
MNCLPHKLADEIRRLLNAGHSNRQISRVVGVALRTVGNITAGLPRPNCPCGKPGGHKGWCGPRLAASPRRQQFMADFVEHVSIWTAPADAIVRAGWEGGEHETAIAAKVNALPLKVSVTLDAVKSRATVLKLRRPPGYMARLRREGRCGRKAGTPNKATWERFIARLKPAFIPAPDVVPHAPEPKAVKRGYVGLLTGPDPHRAIKERQLLEASRGRL